MRLKLVLMSLCVVLISIQAKAQDVDASKCQNLAQQFSVDPGSLSQPDLQILDQCVHQKLKTSADSQPPKPPAGVDIEAKSPSTGAVDTEPPQPPQGLRILED